MQTLRCAQNYAIIPKRPRDEGTIILSKGMRTNGAYLPAPRRVLARNAGGAGRRDYPQSEGDRGVRRQPEGAFPASWWGCGPKTPSPGSRVSVAVLRTLPALISSRSHCASAFIKREIDLHNIAERLQRLQVSSFLSLKLAELQKILGRKASRQILFSR